MKLIVIKPSSTLLNQYLILLNNYLISYFTFFIWFHQLFINLALMQVQKQTYPLYQYCLFTNIFKYKGKLISIVGKIIAINSDQQYLTIEADPVSGRSFKVIVPEFQVSYLFHEDALNKIEDKEDLLFAQNFINNNNKKHNSKNKQNQEGNYTSLMWFTVSSNEELLHNKMQHKEQNKNSINPASLTKKINVNQFFVNQYIEVRGKCINETTIEMQEFTNFDENYDLESHNYALNLGLQYCQKILA